MEKRKPAYRELASLLRREIEEGGKPGLKLPSEKELTRIHGVSQITVRAALRLLREDGWIERRQGAGTFVAARPLENFRVGILVDYDISHPRASHFFTSVAQEVQKFLELAGISARLYTGTRHPTDFISGVSSKAFLDALREGELSGVVCVMADYRTDWPSQLCPALPMVWGVGPEKVASYDYVSFAREGVRELVGMGCRRIASLGYIPKRNPQGAGAEFRKVVLQTLEELNLPALPEWHAYDLHPLQSGAGWSELREIWTTREEKPDGILVADSALPPDFTVGLLSLGIRVPEQLRVVVQMSRGFPFSLPFPCTVFEADPAEVAQVLGARMQSKLLSPLSTAAHKVLSMKKVEYQPPDSAVRKPFEYALPNRPVTS